MTTPRVLVESEAAAAGLQLLVLAIADERYRGRLLATGFGLLGTAGALVWFGARKVRRRHPFANTIEQVHEDIDAAKRTG